MNAQLTRNNYLTCLGLVYQVALEKTANYPYDPYRAQREAQAQKDKDDTAKVVGTAAAAAGALKPLMPGSEKRMIGVVSARAVGRGVVKATDKVLGAGRVAGSVAKAGVGAAARKAWGAIRGTRSKLSQNISRSANTMKASGAKLTTMKGNKVSASTKAYKATQSVRDAAKGRMETHKGILKNYDKKTSITGAMKDAYKQSVAKGTPNVAKKWVKTNEQVDNEVKARNAKGFVAGLKERAERSGGLGGAASRAFGGFAVGHSASKGILG